ncbi:MAG: LacI family DNA-binding transcriptional regulator [Dysosmobacter welbionis]
MKRGVTVNPTIYDVSRLSGVSIATVSRAFSNPERVREDTRRKVFEAAEVLHYSPNAIARAMARQRTDKIAFLICKEGPRSWTNSTPASAPGSCGRRTEVTLSWSFPPLRTGTRPPTPPKTNRWRV